VKRAERSGLIARLSLFVALSMGWNGYVFGQADHGIHLVFVDRLLHPGRWSGDFLDLAAAHHPSLLWWIEAGLSRLLGMPLAFFVLHVLALGATAWGIERLIRSLGGSESAVVAGLLILAPAQFALGGVATLDPLLLPRGAALPLELFALSALCERRFKIAFFLLGLSACLHAPSAAGLAFASCLVLVLCKTERGASSSRYPSVPHLLSPFWFFVAASPVIALWLLAGEQGAGLSQVDPDWLALIDARLSHHIDPKSWPARAWLGMGGWMLAGALATHRSLTLQGKLRFLGGLVAGSVLWAVLTGTLLARGLRLELALQLEAWECFRLVTVLVGCCLAIWLEEFLSSHHSSNRRAAGPALVVILGLALLSSYTAQRQLPKWHPQGAGGIQQDFVEQAASVLPKNSRIFWPPEGFEYERWRSGLPGTPSWKDGGEVLFDRDLAREWLQSTAEVCGCDPLNFPTSGNSGRLAALRAHLLDSWESRNEDDLRESARRLDATHLVLPKSQLAGANRSVEERIGTGQEPLVAVGGWALVAVESTR